MNASERESNLDAIKAAEFDVLIIGAGINGVSTFRELALNGVSVLLVDKQDFCAGTSAAPSRLIHGGPGETAALYCAVLFMVWRTV